MSLDELRALEQAATPGPWQVGTCSGQCRIPEHGNRHPGAPECQYEPYLWGDRDIWAGPISLDRDPEGIVAGMWDYEAGGIQRAEDAALIVAARNALPGLLGRVAAAEAERDEFQRGCVVLTARVESAEAERDALRAAAWRVCANHPVLLGTPEDALYRVLCEQEYAHGDALAASASGVAEPTTKETRP